jgi:hypothetical protein
VDELLVMDDEKHGLPFTRVTIGAALVVAVLAVAGLFACHRMHQTPFMGTPERISVCGRTYSGPGTHETLTTLTSAGAHPVERVWTWQGRREVWGQRLTLGEATSCGTGVYLRVGPNDFRGFALLGGP